MGQAEVILSSKKHLHKQRQLLLNSNTTYLCSLVEGLLNPISNVMMVQNKNALCQHLQ